MQLAIKLQTEEVLMPIKAIDSSGEEATVTIAFTRDQKASDANEKIATYEANTENEDELRLFIAENILGVLKAPVTYVEDNGKKGLFIVPDTRKEKEKEGFWSSAEEATEIVVDLLLQSPLWFREIANAYRASLSNIFLDEDAFKEAKKLITAKN